MFKVCRFNPFSGEWGGGGGDRRYTYLFPPIFCHKLQTEINFSQNVLTFYFYGQLKHDVRSLRYVSRCFVSKCLGMFVKVRVFWVIL